MFTCREYYKADSLEQAWKTNQKRANRILGGMGWMKMTRATFGTAIDLSALGLDQIQETEEEFILGAMVTLRQFETHEGLNTYFQGAMKEATRHIVGVQFRNCATIGGSVWLRAGFSDILTLLLALDSSVELYQGKQETTLVTLSDFCQMKKDNSILLAIHIRKSPWKVVYTSFRNTETDFPVLALALRKSQDHYVASVGARPFLAAVVEGESPEEVITRAQELSYADNLRASADYRRMLAGVLIRRAAADLEEKEDQEIPG